MTLLSGARRDYNIVLSSYFYVSFFNYFYEHMFYSTIIGNVQKLTII